MSFGGKQSFYFLVKWRGRPSSQSTWEDEYFLRDQYEHILKFAAIQVVKESVPDKGQSQTVDELLSQVITAKSLFVRGLEACMPELARGLLRDIFDTEMGSKNSMLIQAVPGYEVFILDYIDISKVSSDKKLPALVVVGSEDSARWRGTAAMYYPSLQIYHEDIIREKSGQDFRSKLIQLQKNSEKFDVVLLECEIVLKYFMDIGKTNWGTIVFDVSVGNSIVFKTLDTFNKPFNRTLTPRIACIPVLTVQSVGKAVINQTISLQVALRRFTNSPSLGSALLAHGLFPSAKDQTLDFYLSTTPSSSLLSSVPSSELAGLENRLERPVEPPQVGQLGRIVLRTIILRLSDLSKGRYADILKENSGWLAEAEKHKKHEDTYIGQMRGLAARLCAVEEELLTKTVDEDSKVLEADSKLRWLIKYFEALKLSGLNERIVLVFVSEKAQLRSLQILQRFTKYSLWQINDNIDSAERNIRIAEFSRVKHKTAIMTVHFKNIWRLRGVQSNIILIMGNTGESYQEELKVKLKFNLESLVNGRQILNSRPQSVQVGIRGNRGETDRSGQTHKPSIEHASKQCIDQQVQLRDKRVDDLQARTGRSHI